MNYSTIALLTDFSTKDSYIASMKAVIISQQPSARIIDISHDISSYNIKEAAYVIYSCYRYFPKGTVFICVVDPGVGSKRKAIVLETNSYAFISPDNGLLHHIFHEENGKLYELNNPDFWISNPSSTFHGRDIFAPCAAALLNGFSTREIGMPVKIPVKLDIKDAEIGKDFVKGSIIYVDSFGNLITNIRSEMVNEHITAGKTIAVRVNEKEINGISRLSETFSEVSIGLPVIYIGSSGLIELGINQENAQERYHGEIGNSVLINFY